MTRHPSGDDFHKAAMAGDVKLFVAQRVQEAAEFSVKRLRSIKAIALNSRDVLTIQFPM